MKGISDRMAEVIVRRSGRGQEYTEVISYGLQAVLGTIVEFISVVLIGLALGLFKEVVAVALVFSAMRMMAGGVHFSTYPRCYVSSVFMLSAAGYAAGYLYTCPRDAGTAYLLSAAGLVVYSLWRYSPRDNPNRLIKEEELPKFRKMSFVFAGTVFACLAAMYIVQGRTGWYHFSLVTGLALEGFTLTDAGYRLANSIERMLERRGGVHDEKS